MFFNKKVANYDAFIYLCSRLMAIIPMCSGLVEQIGDLVKSNSRKLWVYIQFEKSFGL